MTALPCVCSVYCSQVFFFSLSSKRELHYLAVALPDIVFVGEKYDDSRVGVFSQSPDDLIKLALFWLPRNLDWLWEAHTTWIKKFEDVNECLIHCIRKIAEKGKQSFCESEATLPLYLVKVKYFNLHFCLKVLKDKKQCNHVCNLFLL